MNEDQMRELFREMREEPVPADSLARVRLAVAGRTSKAPRWKAGWPWAPIVVVAACVALVFLLPRPAGPPEPPRTVAKHVVIALPEVPEPESPAKAGSQTGPALVQMRPEPRPEPKPRVHPKQDLSMRIETGDPDVVLFFLADKSAE